LYSAAVSSVSRAAIALSCAGQSYRHSGAGGGQHRDLSHRGIRGRLQLQQGGFQQPLHLGQLVQRLRRSCITNWARHLPIHVVQQLAGHSDINTTQQYYLSVRAEDVVQAQAVQQSLLGKILDSGATDQKLTNSARKRTFPGKRATPSLPQPPAN